MNVLETLVLAATASSNRGLLLVLLLLAVVLILIGAGIALFTWFSQNKTKATDHRPQE